MMVDSMHKGPGLWYGIQAKQAGMQNVTYKREHSCLIFMPHSIEVQSICVKLWLSFVLLKHIVTSVYLYQEWQALSNHTSWRVKVKYRTIPYQHPASYCLCLFCTLYFNLSSCILLVVLYCTSFSLRIVIFPNLKILWTKKISGIG